MLKVVGYYDLSVLPMSVMGFQKKVWMGVGGWVELYPNLFWIFGFFLTLQSPILTLSRFTLRLLVFSPSTKLMASIKLDFPAMIHDLFNNKR